MSEYLRITSDSSLYVKLAENNFAPIVITVMGMHAKVFVAGNDSIGNKIIQLRRIDNAASESIGEIELVTAWIVSDDKIWNGFSGYKTIETCKGVID